MTEIRRRDLNPDTEAELTAMMEEAFLCVNRSCKLLILLVDHFHFMRELTRVAAIEPRLTLDPNIYHVLFRILISVQKHASANNETQSQSFRREPEQQQAYLIPATLISESVSAGKTLVRGSVNLARWLTTTGAVPGATARTVNCAQLAGSSSPIENASW